VHSISEGPGITFLSYPKVSSFIKRDQNHLILLFNPNKYGLFRGYISWGGALSAPPPAEIKMNIEISLFIIPIFKSYKNVNHRNFPQPSSLKNYAKITGLPHENGHKN